MWLVLILASFGELGFTVFMKLSNGFKNVKYTILTVVTISMSIFLLSAAIRTLPLGIAYAAWTGLGTILNVLFGIFVFKESRDWKKLMFLGLILMGIIGLRLSA